MAFALVAWSDHEGTQPPLDAGAGGAAPFVPAAHPPLPLIIDSGGPVIAQPKVQPIAYLRRPPRSSP